MKRSLWKWAVLIIVIFVIVPWAAEASRKPVVVSHDETYVNKTVRFRVVWQAENPVVAVRIFAGKEQKEIKVDEYDNRRTRDGYTGEVTAVVELDPSFAEPFLAYVIQVEDDVRLRSDPVSGKIQISQTGTSTVSQPSPTTDLSQQAGVTMQPGGQAQPGSTLDVISKVAGMISTMDLPPVIGAIRINRAGINGVSVGAKAYDDKGLTKVSFKIFDNMGNLVQQDEATMTGKFWEGSSKFFTLVNGNYRVVVQATDSTGNTSPEKTEFFAITGSETIPSSSPAAGTAGVPTGAETT